MNKKIVFLFVSVASFATVFAQNKLLRSSQLMDRSLYPATLSSNFGFIDNNTYYYQKDTLFFSSSAKTQADKQLLSLSVLNRILANSGFDTLSRFPRGVSFSDVNHGSFLLQNKKYSFDLSAGKALLVADYVASGDYAATQDDVNCRAYTVDNGLSVVDARGKTVWSVSDKNKDIVFGQSVHRNEFGINTGIFWSPKGSRLAFYRMDQSMVSDYPMVNTHSRIASSSPFKYPMAGMKSHEVSVGVHDMQSGMTCYLATCKDTSVAEREMYLTNVTWSPDENFVYIAKVNRDQNHLWLERYNAVTGSLDKVLFEEQNDRYVEPCEGLFFLPNNPRQFLWLSMRDGFKHLYLYDVDGRLLKQMSHGNFEIEGVIGFDPKGNNLFVYANKDNLIGRAVYRINMKTGEMIRITSAEGYHTAILNPAGTLIIDRYSSLSTPLKVCLLDINGRVLKTIDTAANPLADYDMPGISLGSIKAADGHTDLFYRLITPPHLDPNKKYPTLVYVYGGPHSQLVEDSWLAGGNLYFLFLAQQGYVVFTLDGRGTDNRGFDFESCTHRQLGTIELADQMQGVKFLQSLPYVDTARMGVEGWSFGGFMTITMKLAHPEIFKVACAGGPVIDWKWYEVMYGERYMDTPQQNPEGYKNASLLAKAKDLTGRLLVIHGAEDNTVVWQHSIEFIERCINNGKQVDYFIYPHHEHNVRGPERVHLYEKMFDYYESFLK